MLAERLCNSALAASSCSLPSCSHPSISTEPLNMYSTLHTSNFKAWYTDAAVSSIGPYHKSSLHQRRSKISVRSMRIGWRVAGTHYCLVINLCHRLPQVLSTNIRYSLRSLTFAIGHWHAVIAYSFHHELAGTVPTYVALLGIAGCSIEGVPIVFVFLLPERVAEHSGTLACVV